MIRKDDKPPPGTIEIGLELQDFCSDHTHKTCGAKLNNQMYYYGSKS